MIVHKATAPSATRWRAACDPECCSAPPGASIAVMGTDPLCAELIHRFALAESKDRGFSERRNPVTPA